MLILVLLFVSGLSLGWLMHSPEIRYVPNTETIYSVAVISESLAESLNIPYSTDCNFIVGESFTCPLKEITEKQAQAIEANETYG